MQLRTLTFALPMALLAGSLLAGGDLFAGDWPRFRGPNGSGVSPDQQPTPVKWGDKENLKWKAELPGPGGSSPIVVGDRVFITCWSGYGTEKAPQGKLEDLKRHLVCLDRKTGKTLWDRSVKAALPEDYYEGMFAEHGYATHTPVSDGERVIAFFGKSGVHAFDMEGKSLWNVEVGSDLDQRQWGSASSPIMYKNLVIVTAAVESHALVALDKTTGKEVWKEEADGFGSTWGTPILVKVSEERTDLVLAVPFEIWGFNPDTGKLRWYCEAIGSNSMCASVIAHEGIVYAMESGPGGGGAIAVRAGGKGDVTESHVVWTTRDRSRIGTPVFQDGRLYWISNKIANCINAKSGDSIYQKRLNTTAASGNRGPGPGARQGDRQGNRQRGGNERGGANRGQRFGQGRGDGQQRQARGEGQPGRRRGGYRGGRGGRGGGQDYSSPVVADGKVYYVTRTGDMVVYKLGEEFEQLAQNRFSDGGQFISTPAVSNGELFIRSSKNLYCVAKSE